MQLLQIRKREAFMVESSQTPSPQFLDMETGEEESELCVGDISIATPDRGTRSRSCVGAAKSGWEKCPVKKPTYIRIALEDLKCFEVVEAQFAHWGITFNNAIAIQPSNPAFVNQPGMTVLMGAPQHGIIEIFFESPVKFVSGLVTSSRRAILAARDREGNLLDQVQLAGPNLVGSNSSIAPSTPLSISATNIYQVTFYAFDGQLIVDDLTFSF
jgi:hypothetical protein